MKRRIFALVDCDNFYASCQRVWDSTIRDRPVIVLSNNDACVIARSKEAKALGIQMGTPFFQCQKIVERYQVAVFSAAYALYNDMSDRIMRILARFSPAQEIYSVDECWLDLSHIPDEKLEDVGRAIRRQVLVETGLFVSVGLATTKVLAKVACELVKRHGIFHGVLSLVSWPEKELDGWLRGIAPKDLWGIGARQAERLQAVGIVSARMLKQADHAWIRHYLSVNAQRVVLELQGISCLPIETTPKPRQGIMVAWSFGCEVESLTELKQAVATYAVRAMEKVRRQGSCVRRVSVFIQTNPWNHRTPGYANEASARLPYASAFTPDVLDLALALLETIYRPGFAYKRAGVWLTDVSSQSVIQWDLFGVVSQEGYERQARVMRLVAEINEQWGRDTLFFCAQGIQRGWMMKQDRRSQRFTTRWDELLRVGEG